MFKRKDGVRVDTPDTAQLMIDIKPKRHENEVYIKEQLDVTALVNYLGKLKEEGNHYTIFYALLTILVKVMYNREKLNYFVGNRHIYKHNGISMGFVAKVAFEDYAKEAMLVLDTKPEDNIDTIALAVKNKLDKLRVSKENDKKGANNAVSMVAKLPNILRIPLMGILKIIDYYGWMFEGIKKDNIYYSSMIVSNLGSIGCGAIYHDLSDFGNCSSLVTFGKIIDEVVVINGEQQIRKVCDVGVTLDERVADGFYFARSINLAQIILNNPESLFNNVGEKIPY